MKLCEMILDYNLYPRQHVDATHVGYLREAILAGSELPPILVDAVSNRVVDGFHRHGAYLGLYDENYDTPVVKKKFKTEADLFLAAVRANSAHGYRMSRLDQAHCLINATHLDIDTSDLAQALHVSAERIDALRIEKTAKFGSQPIALKRTIAHKAGQRLTKKQVETNRRLGGMRQTFYVNQLIMLIENDLLDTQNVELMLRVKRLAEVLKDVTSKE